MTIVLIVQASAVLGALEGSDFDLRAVNPPKTCTSKGEEIVVCGRKDNDETFRLRTLPPSRFDPKPLRATVGLGTGTLGIEGDQKTFPNGEISNRVMLKLKVPF